MKKIVFSIWLIVATFSVAAICSSCGKKEERGELKRIWYNGSYNRDFKDLNDVHLAEANVSVSNLHQTVKRLKR